MTDSSRHDSMAALKHPYVRALIIGRVASAIGMQFVSVAVGWELYERTGDAWALGLVGLIQVIPVLALMLPAGNAADVYPRRHIAMAAQAVLAIASLGLAVVSWMQAPVEIVYGLLLITGVGRAFSMPATSTMLPQLIEPRQYANANAWTMTCQQVASVTAPALCGYLIWLSGAATTSYAVAGVGQLVHIAMLATLPVVAPQARAGARTVMDLLAGVLFIRRQPIFLSAITLDLFAVLLGGATALLPVYAKDILQVGPDGLGLLRAAPSLGAMVTAYIATRIPPWERPGRVLMMMVAAFGVATVGFGLSRDMTLSLVCLFFIGASDSISMVIRHTLQQVITPDHLRGRVAATSSVFIGLSNELGAFESGAVAALFGAVVSVVGGGIGTLVVVTIVALLCPALAKIGPLHTLRPAAEPVEAEAVTEGVVKPAAV
ncbi:MAG: MFS transporter [Chloroflexota bacterium]